MGIPGFTARLAAHGVRTTLGRTHGDDGETRGVNEPDSAAIIDGPGLAYYVYHQLRVEDKWDSTARFSPLKPKYHVIGQRAVTFLEDMDYAIHFDGVLPASKLETRQARLQRTIERLTAVKGAVRLGQKTGLQFIRVLELSSQSLSTQSTLPEPPFLVTCVLDAISGSRFAECMTVVPAEADDYCAIAAATYETDHEGKAATIVSNDSDLIILSSQTQARMMLLEGLEIRKSPTSTEIQATLYHPAAIARASGLPDLLETAYYMADDRHTTLETALKKAKQSSSPVSSDYLAFGKQYAKPTYRITGLPVPVQKVLASLDPRVAEVAHQSMPDFPTSHNQRSNAFLPPLYEDVDRFDAWQVGLRLRSSAYSMVFAGDHNAQWLHEYTRHGKRVASTKIELTADWSGDLVQYSHWLLDIRSWFSQQASPSQFWQYVAMSGALACLAERGAQPPSQSVLEQVLRKATPASLDTMHLTAMCQAALYSHRMLKQLLSLENVRRGLHERLKPLMTLLDDMPGIADIVEPSAADTKQFWSSYANDLHASFSADEQAMQEDESEDKDQNADEEAGGEDQTSPLGSNPFNILYR